MKLILRVHKDSEQSAVVARFYPCHFTTTCHQGNSTLTSHRVCKFVNGSGPKKLQNSVKKRLHAVAVVSIGDKFRNLLARMT